MISHSFNIVYKLTYLYFVSQNRKCAFHDWRLDSPWLKSSPLPRPRGVSPRGPAPTWRPAKSWERGQRSPSRCRVLIISSSLAITLTGMERLQWNQENIVGRDPVLLGMFCLCGQTPTCVFHREREHASWLWDVCVCCEMSDGGVQTPVLNNPPTVFLKLFRPKTT